MPSIRSGATVISYPSATLGRLAACAAGRVAEGAAARVGACAKADSAGRRIAMAIAVRQRRRGQIIVHLLVQVRVYRATASSEARRAV